MQGEIERNQWETFLDEFSRRNQMRPTRLEIIGEEIGAQEEENLLPFSGISFETKGTASGSVEIILGGQSAADSRSLTHTVTGVKRIMPLVGAGALEDGLGIESEDGVKTLLRFETLPEIPETTSEAPEAA
ncbi:MAG TPA: DUF5335 family protein [Pyrinomonadaceae bacterium]|jgi:hypothetical protein|nr:DUF5335 family protein [Pyrinomonadaceae bacterium]